MQSGEKRVLLAVALSFLVMLVWFKVFPPAVPPPAPAEAPAEVSTPAPAPEEPLAAQPTSPSATEPIAAENAEDVKVETDLHSVVFTNKGGRVKSWGLRGKDYATGGQPLDLVPATAAGLGLPLALDLDDKTLSDRANDALYRVEREQTEEGGATIRFTWADASGLQVVKTVSFRPSDYIVDVQVAVTQNAAPLPARITWGPGFAAGSADAAGRFHYVGQAVLKPPVGPPLRLERHKVEGERRLPAAGVLWAGLEEQYFAALFLPDPGKADVVVRPVAAPVQAGQKKPDPELIVAVTVPPDGLRLFIGPKKFSLLRSLGHELDAVVWFSNYALVSWLAKMFFLGLAFIHDRIVPNYGFAVILLTVTVRILLFPVNQYSMVSMRKMQVQMQRIQPKINAIKNKFKKKDAESRQKMNQEMMALYQKEGVNPMGSMSGCLPMLAQFPILIAFYDMLVATVELRGAPFVGWIHDLTQKDPLYVTPVLMGATMFLQQWLGMTKSADPAQAQQQKIMLMMPVVFTVTFLNLPSGLVLYWFVNNLLGIGQQWLVNRHMGRLEAAAQKA